AIWILYARLHDDLRAYTYAQAVAAHERGTPIVRPLVFVHPDRPEYVDLWETYLYGPDLLVRPVWERGARSVTVHIPPGEWRDLWTGETWEGPRTIAVEAPLHVIPAYVRMGSELDHLDLAARWVEAQKQARSQPDLSSLLPAHGW
ncbi:MAG: glycoside hydrolase family 31 protein, partial [Candidatus Bipolaricaulis anaerobius]|nr:glycoside hydrolase family 31 protein [Candidatus Bipolaricaulis anaerobius]